MVAVLAELEPRPLSTVSARARARRPFLEVVDEYVAGPRTVPAFASVAEHRPERPAPKVRPIVRPATIRPAVRPEPSAARAELAQVFLWRRVAVIAVAVATLVLGIWGASVLGGGSLVASGHRSAPVTYTVKPGDSLWSVAQRVAPQEDPRKVVAELERARGGAPLIPGQTIIWAR